jgi:hypothetical protein
MKSKSSTAIRSRVIGILLALAALLGASVAVAPASSAATLWYCPIPNVGNEVCTVLTSLPGGTGQVLDRITGRTVTVHNGDSVYLGWYWNDSSSQCAVGGDAYVWEASWFDPNGRHHWGFVPDWYLATGSPSYWRDYPDPVGQPLGGRFAGFGTGPCNQFPFPPDSKSDDLPSSIRGHR